MAQLLAADGDHAAAVKTFRTFVALEPGSYRAWSKLGDSLAAQGKSEEAVGAYRKVVESHPDFMSYKSLGDALLELGEVEEAVATFEMALDETLPTIEPNSPGPANPWASTVEKLATLPVKVRAQLAPAIAKLGDKFRERGENGLAADCYRQAMSAQPKLVTAQHGLALALALQDRKGVTDTPASLPR